MAEDLYSVLGVAADADDREITAAYRRLVFEFHPDRNKSPEAEARTAEINRAYGVLSDERQRAVYDSRRGAALRHAPAVPRAIIGTSKLALYDLLEHKPRHRHVLWEPGIWSSIMASFPNCRLRHCLVLLRIDPDTNEQIYQHGDPGPVLRIDPTRGEFSLLKPWLDQCHELEDGAMATAS